MGTEREREREREGLPFLFFFNFNFSLVHKIRLGMHDYFLSFQVLFLFSRQDIGIYLSPTEVLQRSVFFFFLYYVFGRTASIWLARFPFVFGR